MLLMIVQRVEDLLQFVRRVIPVVVMLAAHVSFPNGGKCPKASDRRGVRGVCEDVPA